MKNISLISPSSCAQFEQYYLFRWQQLRQPLNLPKGSEQDEYESISFHQAAIDERNNVIGVGRISPESSAVMRIRYMAVADDFRRQGIGSHIVQNLLAYAKQNNVGMCWLNARENAVEFYRKNGFDVINSIETGLKIAHFQMKIQL